MISFNFIYSKKISRIQKGNTINPHAHWKMLLGVFLLLMIGLIVYSLYLLYQIRTEQTFQVKATTADKPTLLKENILTETLTSFDAKAKKEADILDTTPLYKDPSL